MAGNLTDVITCAKFQDDIFRGYNLQGVEFPIFLLIFVCAACDMSLSCLTIGLLSVGIDDEVDAQRHQHARANFGGLR